MRRIVIACIRGYQRHISPHFPAVCRFSPSCSHYTLQAVERFGAVRGCWLGTLRILRCNPFSKGGWDPVPIRFHPLGKHLIPQPDPLSPAQRRGYDEYGWLLAPRAKYRGKVTNLRGNDESTSK